ncbi:hypothetical protein FA13DRAFT_1394733 [Coprinellus micaceus]|uniref:Nephrocystin 3-like N-terminal domain-containing protein n=1 Tax=Coprinellus micaceus TaxID=71717 RepID=A0A4Y7SQI4_COPMI|nr:hypothetical protein FA13DRAFT_1394733 [Coprinellus micaceus]
MLPVRTTVSRPNLRRIPHSQPQDITSVLSLFPGDEDRSDSRNRQLGNDRPPFWRASAYLSRSIPSLPSLLHAPPLLRPAYSVGVWVCGVRKIGRGPSCGRSTGRRTMSRCSFFFFRNLGDRSRMSKFAETIASQISTSIDGTARHIQAALIAHPGLLQPTTSPIIQFKHLVYDPIVAVSATRYRPMGIWRPYTILIDGFDECEDREGASEWIKDLILFFGRNPRSPCGSFLRVE